MRDIKQYTTNFSKIFALAVLVLVLLASCSEKPKIRIALSKGSGSAHYEAYAKWLKASDENIETVDLINMSLPDALTELDGCSGLVLTGGPDVHPGRFGRAYDTSRCSIDEHRDTLEFALIKRAMDLKLPILGVCRGEQILNVALGGSLIVDIPSDYPDTSVTHQCPDPDTCFHPVKITAGTLLYKIVKVKEGVVNTNHHQGVDRLADELIPSAHSPDGLIEAVEWKNPAGKPFMIAVQWHPERLEHDNPLSMRIANRFLEEARSEGMEIKE